MSLTIEQCIYDYVTKHPSIQPLIGTKLFPDFLPEIQPGATWDLPAVVYTFLDERSVPTNTGPSALREGLWQFDIWGIKALTVWQIRRAFLDALGDCRVTMGDQNNVVSLFERAARFRDPETMAFCMSMRFNIWYHEVKVSSP